MLIPGLEDSIKSLHIGHQDHSLLFAFLERFSPDEQQTLADVAMRDEHLWMKLLVRIRVLKTELAHGSTRILAKEMDTLIQGLTSATS